MTSSTTTTRAMIAATVDEFSFMFTDIPPRPCIANSSPTVKYYPPHPHRDFVIQVNEKLEAWNGRTYPPSPPTSNELSPSSSTRRPTIDRSNPYDLYGAPTAESVTPTHTLFLDEHDQDRSATTSPATSTSESGTPAAEKFETIELETPYTDSVPSAAPPAYRETPENPYYTKNMHYSKPSYIPFEYTQLPHFHPPRFSRRLRLLIAERRRPMQLSLLPLHQPRPDEKKQWIIETPDSTLLPTPKGSFLQRWDNFLQWWDSFDPRLVVFVSLMTIMVGIFIISLALTGFWV